MSATTSVPGGAGAAGTPAAREQAVVRFAGDSGDGMQITGARFAMETALAGSDLATFPDFPAEIRAPLGTTFGVSAFQIHFGSVEVATAGDDLDVLVAMNPAALITNIKDLRPQGILIADKGAFTERNLLKAGYKANPLEDGSLSDFTVLPPCARGVYNTKICSGPAALGLGVWNPDIKIQRNRVPGGGTCMEPGSPDLPDKRPCRWGVWDPGIRV